MFYSSWQFFVQGGFSPQKNQVGLESLLGKQAQPLLDGVNGKGVVTVLIRVDIAMGTGQVAPGQDVKKKVGSIFGKGNGFFFASSIPCTAW